MKKEYSENMITTMTLRIVERDKRKFNRLREKITQHDFLNKLLDIYEKKTFNGIRINDNNSISILLKSYIQLLNLNEYITPKKYTFFGNIIFESNEIATKINSTDISNHIKQDILDCRYKWSVLYDKYRNKYLVYEEFVRPNLDVRRCRVTNELKDVIQIVDKFAYDEDIENFRYTTADDIPFDELNNYV